MGWRQSLKEAFQPYQAPSTLEPAAFGDPVALKTQWGPLRSGGSNFRTSGLVERSPERLEFRPSIQMSLFAGVFILLPLLFAVVFYFVPPDSGPFPRYAFIPAGMFSLIGVVLLVASRRPIVFDQVSGFFYRQWKPPRHFEPETMRNAALLRDIHALQIVQEHVRGKSSFLSYELNLVLRNGDRLNVLDHGALEALRGDAARLGRWLGRPVWDSTNVPTTAAKP